MIAVLDVRWISATVFIAPAVDEFNYNTFRPVFGVILQSIGSSVRWTRPPAQSQILHYASGTKKPILCPAGWWGGFGPLRSK